jgi:integrase
MLTIRKREGIYQVDWNGHDIRGTLGTRSKEAANRLKHRLENAIADGPDSPRWPELSAVLPRGTYQRFEEYFGVKEKFAATWQDLRKRYEQDLWQRHAIHIISLNSVKNLLRAMREFDLFLSSRENPITLLRDIDKPLAKEFKYDRIRKIQAKKGENSGAGATVDCSLMHIVFAFAIECGLVSVNPFPSELPRGSAERGAQPFEPEELNLLREHAKDDWLIFMVLRWTGLRESDAASLKWEEIDLNNRKIRKYTKKSQYKKQAIIGIDKELLHVLQKERETRNPQPGDRVLQHPKVGKSVNENYLQCRIRKLGERAGVKASPHRFRDTCAVDMLLRDISIEAVAATLGDTVPTVRKYYSPYVRVFQEQTLARLDSGTKLEDRARHKSVTPIDEHSSRENASASLPRVNSSS